MMDNVKWVEISQFFDISKPVLRILVILLLAWICLHLSRRLNVVVKLYMDTRQADPQYIRRVDTLSGVLRYVAGVAIAVVAGMLILGELGISIAPLLATAGVAGIAIGFGAQSLVKDLFTGLFLLLEDQIREGDSIEAAGKVGYVEHVTLRHIRLRDYDGSVHFIPNGMITAVTNRSREFAYAVIDFTVARRYSVDVLFAEMRRVAEEMRTDPMVGAKILDDVEIAGVEKVEDATITVRCRLKVVPIKQWSVRREFLTRIKAALDKLDQQEAQAKAA
jgi:moderate conductance mechanosensitive channel